MLILAKFLSQPGVFYLDCPFASRVITFATVSTDNMISSTRFQMKNDFKKMEEEMDNLSVKMSAITVFNDKISNTLQEKRLQITKLSGVHALLRKVCTLMVCDTQCLLSAAIVQLYQ